MIAQFDQETYTRSPLCFSQHLHNYYGVQIMMKKRQVVIKRDHGSGRSACSTTSSSVLRSVRYGECQKNHAANIGRYAVDGCREFMASGEEGTNGALMCAACGCHRNFHKREVETEVVCEYSPPNSSRR